MGRSFFTYVWGPPGEPAWPLTFANKASRAHARRVLTEGDEVFTVCTRGEPTEERHRGRVGGVFRVSGHEVNTADYDLPRKRDDPRFDSVARFPYALHPLAVWAIDPPDNVFADLVGPLTPRHHLQAQSQIVALDPDVAAPILQLNRREVRPALPATEFGRGLLALRTSKLAPAHHGTYSAAFGEHATWFVYTLVLRDAARKPIATKIGYASDPEARAARYNSSLATEVTGLRWSVDLKQPFATEAAARRIEQSVLKFFRDRQLPSNGEIVSGVDPQRVAVAIATAARADHGPS